MRIVAIADTHLWHDDLDPLPEGDVLVHAGDLLRGGTMTELRLVAPWLAAQPHRHKVVIAGNHDWPFFRERERAVELLGDSVTYLQDGGATIEGVRFWGSPWQPEFGGWAFNLPRGEALAERWALIPADTDVLITHGPPAGFGDDVHGLRVGCDELLAATRRVRPRLHCYGHIHSDGGVWRDGGVCYANVTTDQGERGASVFDLDVATGVVRAVVVPGGGR